MEPEVVAFLKKVSKSIMIAFLWLVVNAVAAIWNDHAFVGDHVTVANVLFYIWFIISVVLLIYLLRRMWQHQPDWGKGEI